MADDEAINRGIAETEFRRQMTNGQMRRYINTLPAFFVERDMPDQFASLLRELDRVAANGTRKTAPQREN